MFILLEHYRKYEENGIVEPPEVKEATREYQRLSDIYVEFKDDCLQVAEGCTVKLEESYNRFKIWFKNNQEGKVPPRKDFRTNLEKHLGKYHNRNGWPGWNFTEEITGLELDPFTLDEEGDGVGEKGKTMNPPPAITPKRPADSAITGTPGKKVVKTPIISLKK